MDVDGIAGRDGVWHAREMAAMNAAAIRVRVIADFQDRGLTSLLALTGGMEHVFMIVLTSFVVRLEASIWRPAGALPYQPIHLTTSYHDQLEVIRVLTPARGRATTLLPPLG